MELFFWILLAAAGYFIDHMAGRAKRKAQAENPGREDGWDPRRDEWNDTDAESLWAEMQREKREREEAQRSRGRWTASDSRSFEGDSLEVESYDDLHPYEAELAEGGPRKPLDQIQPTVMTTQQSRIVLQPEQSTLRNVTAKAVARANSRGVQQRSSSVKLNRQTVKQGIIMMEVLGKPKGLA